jgi:hypothetical protein
VRRTAGLTAALVLAILLLPATRVAGRGRQVSLTSSCGPSCVPAPTAFTVPAGQRAGGFKLVRLSAGRACEGSASMAGFSIRRGARTVLVYYDGPDGPVSDPLPLGDLVLAPGSYELLAAPARGASVTLSFTLDDGK